MIGQEGRSSDLPFWYSGVMYPEGGMDIEADMYEEWDGGNGGGVGPNYGYIPPSPPMVDSKDVPPSGRGALLLERKGPLVDRYDATQMANLDSQIDGSSAIALLPMVEEPRTVNGMRVRAYTQDGSSVVSFWPRRVCPKCRQLRPGPSRVHCKKRSPTNHLGNPEPEIALAWGQSSGSIAYDDYSGLGHCGICGHCLRFLSCENCAEPIHRGEPHCRGCGVRHPESLYENYFMDCEMGCETTAAWARPVKPVDAEPDPEVFRGTREP